MLYIQQLGTFLNQAWSAFYIFGVRGLASEDSELLKNSIWPQTTVFLR